MSTQPLEQAIQSTRSVLEGVKRDQLASPTPCKSWTVSQLVDHIVGGQYFFAAAINGEPLGGEQRTFADGDFLAEFDKGSAACLAAFGSPDAMDRTVKMPFGDMPGSRFVGLATTDTFVHGWDLAKATGQTDRLDPELAEAGYGIAVAILQPQFRNDEGDPFAPLVAVSDAAPIYDRLAGFAGRTP